MYNIQQTTIQIYNKLYFYPIHFFKNFIKFLFSSSLRLFSPILNPYTNRCQILIKDINLLSLSYSYVIFDI